MFTIGHLPQLSISRFFDYLTRNHVNCVVDIRQNPEAVVCGDFKGSLLFDALRARNILYMSFNKEFGHINTSISYSSISLYRQCVQSVAFVSGIKRLERGVEKGFNIVLLGSSALPVNCIRYNVIGRYLIEQGWQVLHILEDGIVVSQQALLEREKKIVEERIKKNNYAKQLGNEGEELAALYLMQNGYRILDRNWNLHRGCELDIIAFKDNKLHAVEVKTRTDDGVMLPEQAVDDKKLKNINSALTEYRYRNQLQFFDVQIDTIAVTIRTKGDYTIKMFEDVMRRTKWFY